MVLTVSEGAAIKSAFPKSSNGYEFTVDTENHTSNATKVKATGYRFEGNVATYSEAATHELVWGGRSAAGNTVKDNKLKVTGGTITTAAHTGAVYGGLAENRSTQTGRAGDVSGNDLAIEGATTIDMAYGGKTVTANGKAQENTLTLDSTGANVRTLRYGAEEHCHDLGRHGHGRCRRRRRHG